MTPLTDRELEDAFRLAKHNDEVFRETVGERISTAEPAYHSGNAPDHKPDRGEWLLCRAVVYLYRKYRDGAQMTVNPPGIITPRKARQAAAALMATCDIITQNEEQEIEDMAQMILSVVVLGIAPPGYHLSVQRTIDEQT